MNTANVIKLRDTLAALREHGNEERFDMTDFFQAAKSETDEDPALLSPDPAGCGTAACLLGWACLLGYPGTLPIMPLKQGREWLGLSEREGDWWGMGRWAITPSLGMPDKFYGLDLSEITLPMAITFLDKVLATGDTMAEVALDVED